MKTKTVIVADDHEDMRSLLSGLLHAWGYQVSEAANEDEAIALLQIMRPDVVISDLDMSSSDGGLKVLREVKRLYPDVPVLICSGDFFSQPEITAELEKAGAYRLLQKPYKPDELKAALDSFKRPTIGDVLAWFLKTVGEMPSAEYFDEWSKATVALNRCLCATFGNDPLDLPPDTELDSASHQALLALQLVAEKWKH